MHLLRVGLLLVAIGLPGWASSQAAAGASMNQLRFRADGTNGFVFDTGVVRGTLRSGGRARGLTDVVHVPTGAMISRGMGLFGHYRVFTRNHRYGNAAWDWPGDATLREDGSVEAQWPATEERPFALRVTYRWASPDTLDVVTTVRAETSLTNFESFLASYFAPTFTNALVYVADLPHQPGQSGFLVAEPRFGTWLVFPRDDAALAIVRDGRWTIPPSPVDWVPMPRLAAPLGIRRDPRAGLSAVIMAPPGDAFALCTPEQTEGHYSMYLSLFGRDVPAGETRSARARLWLAGPISDVEARAAYEAYLRQVGATAQRTGGN